MQLHWKGVVNYRKGEVPGGALDSFELEKEVSQGPPLYLPEGRFAVHRICRQLVQGAELHQGLYQHCFLWSPGLQGHSILYL